MVEERSELLFCVFHQGLVVIHDQSVEDHVLLQCLFSDLLELRDAFQLLILDITDEFELLNSELGQVSLGVFSLGFPSESIFKRA